MPKKATRLHSSVSQNEFCWGKPLGLDKSHSWICCKIRDNFSLTMDFVRWTVLSFVFWYMLVWVIHGWVNNQSLILFTGLKRTFVIVYDSESKWAVVTKIFFVKTKLCTSMLFVSFAKKQNKSRWVVMKSLTAMHAFTFHIGTATRHSPPTHTAQRRTHTAITGTKQKALCMQDLNPPKPALSSGCLSSSTTLVQFQFQKIILHEQSRPSMQRIHTCSVWPPDHLVFGATFNSLLVHCRTFVKTRENETPICVRVRIRYFRPNFVQIVWKRQERGTVILLCTLFFPRVCARFSPKFSFLCSPCTPERTWGLLERDPVRRGRTEQEFSPDKKEIRVPAVAKSNRKRAKHFVPWSCMHVKAIANPAFSHSTFLNDTRTSSGQLLQLQQKQTSCFVRLY